MASITQSAKGYRAQVYVGGTRDSATFRTRREAVAWASRRESDLRELKATAPSKRYTVRNALEKYLKDVVPKKRGSRMETTRIVWMLGITSPLPLDRQIGDFTATDVAIFRDLRLTQVKPGSVIRELGLLSVVFEIAKSEWKWISDNPVKEIRKPPEPKHRERVIHRWEARRMLESLGYSRRGCRTFTEAVAYSLLIALRTGMRAGEVCSLRWDQVQSDHLTDVGTKTESRDVALSRKAQALIARLRGWDRLRVVNIEPNTLDALFRRHRVKAGLSGFTFHDSRHTAATWIARKLDVLDLCKMFGWASTSRALTYYNPTASDISKRL